MPNSTRRLRPTAPLTCFGCMRRQDSAWGALTEEEVALLEAGRHTRRYRSGEAIFRQGDPCGAVYCVEAGTVALRRADAAGNSLLVRLVYAGQPLGYRDFFGGQAHTTTAEALEPATICEIGQATLDDLLSRNPSLGLNFLQHISQDLDEAEDALLKNASLSVRTRLAHLLIALAKRHGRPRNGRTVTLTLPLARQDLASLLGTRPETITRTMNALEQERLVSCAGRRVILRDCAALLDGSGTD